MDIEITEKWADRVFAVILAVAGFFCFYRLGYYSLWGDETWVAGSAISSIQQIFAPDSYFPGNPFFILVLKGVVAIFGISEFTLRFVPALFYVLSVFVFYLLLKILTKKNHIVTLIATSLFALNPTLIWFSHDLKQYTIEIFFTLLLFYLAEIYIRDRSDKNFAILFVSSILAVLFSFPAVFIIPAIALRLAVDKYSKELKFFSRENFDRFKGVLLYVLVTAGIFLVYYFSILQERAQKDRIVDYWTSSWSCMPTDYSLSYLVHFVYDSLFSFFQYLFYYSNFETWHYGVLFALFLIGVVYAFYKKEYILLGYGLVPIIINIFASLVKKYPFCGARIDLYLTPFIFVFMAYALYAGVLMFRFDEKLMRVLVVIFIVCASLSIILVHGQETLSLDQIRMDNITQIYLDNYQEYSDHIYITSSWLLYPAYFEKGVFQNDVGGFDLEKIQSNPNVMLKFQFNGTAFVRSASSIPEEVDLVVQKTGEGNRLWVFFETVDRADKIKSYLDFSDLLKEKCNLESSNTDVGVVLDLYQC